MKVSLPTQLFFGSLVVFSLNTLLPAQAQTGELNFEMGKRSGSDAFPLQSKNSFNDNSGTNSAANSQFIPETIASLLGVIGMTLLLPRRREC